MTRTELTTIIDNEVRNKTAPESLTQINEADALEAVADYAESLAVVKVQKTTITSAQILNLFSSPVTILNSDNPLTVACPINVYVKRNLGDGYTLAASTFSVVNDWNIQICNLNANALANSVVGYSQAPITGAQNLSGGDKNVLYKLKANIGNPTGGTGDLDVYVTYIEIPL